MQIVNIYFQSALPVWTNFTDSIYYWHLLPLGIWCANFKNNLKSHLLFKLSLFNICCNLFQLWTITTVIYFFWLAPKKRGHHDGIYYGIDAIAIFMLLPHIFGYYVCFIIFSAYKKMKEENQTNYQSSCDIEMIVDPTSSQCGACGSNLST